MPISTASLDQSPSEEENAEHEANTEKDFVRDLQEIGVMIDEEEVHNWLESDNNDPGFS